MSEKFEIEKAVAQPETLRFPTPVIVNELAAAQPRRERTIKSVSLLFALREMDLLRLNARNLESGISDLMRPTLNVNQGVLSDDEMLDAYNKYVIAMIPTGRAPMSFEEYSSFRDPSAFQRLFVSIANSLGIESSLNKDLR